MKKGSNGFNITVKETGSLDTEAVAKFLEKKVRQSTTN